MKKAVLTRLQADSKQTLGQFTLFDGTQVVFYAKSLELPWLDNKQSVSCIPSGEYKCRKRKSPKFGWCYIVEELNGGHVTGRTWILIHAGNFNRHTKGCILLGTAHKDVDGDGYRDVINSRKAINILNSLGGEEFLLTIVDLT